MRSPALLLLALLFCPSAGAQYVLYGGLADAVNAFGDTNGDEQGRAGYGLAAGFDYEVPSRYERGLTVVVGLALMTSTFDADDLREDLFGAGVREGEVAAQPYVHVPASFGFRYRLFDGARVSPTLGGRVLYSITRFPRLAITDSDGNEIEVEATGAGGFGFSGDVGLSVGDRLDVGVRYFGMGERRFEVEFNAELIDGNEATVTGIGDQPVSVALLYAAYRL
jgi:hypothetical protein